MEIGLLIFIFAAASVLCFKEGVKHGAVGKCDKCLRMGLEMGFKAGTSKEEVNIEVTEIKES